MQFFNAIVSESQHLLTDKIHNDNIKQMRARGTDMDISEELIPMII